MTTPNHQISLRQTIAQQLANDPLLAELSTDPPWVTVLAKLLTVYPPLVELKDKRIPKLAMANIPILILGESGTGKELISRALHGYRKGKFVALNCSGIPSDLLESEFFGHVKGAFTGAHCDKDGYLKDAEGGTLFLDEIGDMPLFLQSKLLRVIEYNTYRKVGSSEEIKANFRLVCATNRSDLENRPDIFRLDLYYRIAGHVITLPSLKERGHEDVELIVRSLANGNELVVKKVLEDLLVGVTLKGNVRQLKNMVEEQNVLMG